MAEHKMSISLFSPGDLGHFVVSCSCQNWHGHITDRKDAEGVFEGHLAYSRSIETPSELESFEAVENPTALLIYRVIRLVAEFYGVVPSELTGPIRMRHIVYARNVSIYLARTQLGLSFPVLAKYFNRNTATLQHSVSGIRLVISENEKSKLEIEHLAAKLARDRLLNPG